MENDAPALPTVERLQHGEVEIRDIEGVGKRAAVRFERRIDQYHFNCLLADNRRDHRENDRRYEAAVKYLGLAYAARPREGQSCLVNLHRVDGGRAGDATVDRIDARAILTRAQIKLHPQDIRCLDAVICDDMSCDAWMRLEYRSRGRKPPRRSEGIFRLRNALRELARHWGL